MSVTERSERNITKRFDELNIDWPIVARQLQAWSHLFCNGKKLINVTFNYVESKTAGTAGRGAGATQLAEMNTRRDAEIAISGRPDPWRQVYSIMQCPGAPCDRGPYCWQDPDGKKHYKLMGHQLRSMVKLVQQGCKIESHGDVPEDIRKQLYAEEQQNSKRKRKRRDSDSQPAGHPPMIINNYIPARPDQVLMGDSRRSTTDSPGSSPSRMASLEIPGLRDDAVMEYCAWHCSKIRSQSQKEQYELARDLTLDNGFDLELIYVDNDAQFYIDRGVLEGVARRWVRDVKAFLGQYNIL